MQPTSPRIPPLEPEHFSDEQAELAGPRGSARSKLHIVRTLVQHPALFRSWRPLGTHLIMGSTLPQRERELLILHTCAACRSTYDLAHHVVIARRAGLVDAEIDAAKGDGGGLPTFEQTLVKAADELVKQHCISNETWAVLAERYTRQQLMDLVFTVGNYILMSMATITFGVPLEEDVERGWKPN